MTDDAAQLREAERLQDDYLVLAAAGGDRRAFDALARRWNGKLTAHAWRLTGERDAAEDAAQAAWVEIARGLGRLRDERAFPAWAYRIVTRRCARLIAGRQSYRRLARDFAAENQTPESMPETDPRGDRLSAAIRALPAAQRAAVALFYFEEMSVAETAVALDIPAGTAKTRLMHARRTLRAALEGDDHA